MISLDEYGWNDFHQQNCTIEENQSLGRVISVKGFKYDLITENGELETELAGRLLYGSDPEDLPKVGDWVTYLDYGETGYIIGVLPRMNALTRKNPGTKIERQVLAANIDFALIVQGLDQNFNVMRLARYITQLTSCGTRPIVILNKADLITDQDFYRQKVTKLKRDCPLFFCSTLTGFGISEVKGMFQKGKTYIMIGSSAVGKSSLLNILVDSSIQRIGPISKDNNKGTHTTTTRDLFRLSGGGLLIDTPGMREFGLTNDSSDPSTELFPAIQEFAQACRYADCTHVNELGCAVIDALQKGSLDTQVYESYMKLMKEQKRFEIKIEDKTRLNEQFGNMTKEAKNHRKKHKY